MSLFGNLKTEGLEETQDRLGGFGPVETDIYEATIKAAYAGESSGGAMSVSLIADLAGGKEYRETFYVTNKKKENFFLNPQDKTKKVPLPGFALVEDICLVTVEKPLAEMGTEEKTIKLWDKDAKKELPKAVDMLIELIGKKVYLAIQKNLENKNELVGTEYVPTAETRDTNNVDKVFHFPSKITVVEARNGHEAKFFDGWLDRNKGKTRDKRELKDGAAGVAGKPGSRAPSTPPAAGQQAGGQRKSLFSKG